jgi:hypothetical protein
MLFVIIISVSCVSSTSSINAKYPTLCTLTLLATLFSCKVVRQDKIENASADYQVNAENIQTRPTKLHAHPQRSGMCTAFCRPAASAPSTPLSASLRWLAWSTEQFSLQSTLFYRRSIRFIRFDSNATRRSVDRAHLMMNVPHMHVATQKGSGSAI